MADRSTDVPPFSAFPVTQGSADSAVRELLFLVAIEGISSLSRGGKGCVFSAVESLRPDIAEQWARGDDPHNILGAYFPDGDEPHHVLILSKHTGRPIGCMAEPATEDFLRAQREDPGCSFVAESRGECPVCAKGGAK